MEVMKMGGGDDGGWSCCRRDVTLRSEANDELSQRLFTPRQTAINTILYAQSSFFIDLPHNALFLFIAVN
ncbi:hypothetical protein GB937_004805 [Aspergillus fischeri]|nr:hypothetical protein GB937_004805 [Aspergillus fischeri]